MENGRKTLKELAEELEWEKNNRYDVIVPSEQLKVSVDVGTNTIKMDVPIVDKYGNLVETKNHNITNYAHGQIADKTGIPKRYYDKMIETSKYDLLAKNINEWLPTKEKRLVRVNGKGEIRALLSDRYQCIDNHDVLYLALEEAKKIRETRAHRIDVLRGDVTESHLYIKLSSPDLKDDIIYKTTKSEPVHGGIIISNSEVGAGAFKVEPFINVLVCQNGLISDKVFKRVHIGRELGTGIINWSDETKMYEDKTLWSKIRDMVQNTFDPEIFHKWVDEINGIASVEVEKPALAIDNVIKHFELEKGKKDDLLNQFMKEGNSQWGLSMAITRVAQDLNSYDRQVEWEKVGAKILTVQPEIFSREI